MKFGVVGLGYVGLATLCGLVKMGHEVVAVERDASKRDMLSRGEVPILEPGMKELLKEAHERVTFTGEVGDVRDVEFVAVAVETPEREDGSCDTSAVDGVLASLPEGTSVVLKSTVPPGTTDGFIARYPHLKIAVMPEFLREGRALADTLKPSRIVIGAHDMAFCERLASLYGRLSSPVVCCRPTEAEMIKYGANSFLAVKISFMNELARLSDAVGADIQTIADGIGLDPRIGRSFLDAGIGYGGSCLPKDTAALLHLAGEENVHLSVVEAAVRANEEQLHQLVHRLEPVRGMRVALLGLAFKPGTDDMRSAPSLALAERLHHFGVEVIGYDPVARWPHAQAETIEEALLDADVAVIVTEWEELAELSPERFEGMRTRRLIDGRNCWRHAKRPGSVRYEGIGRFQAGSTVTDRR